MWLEGDPCEPITSGHADGYVLCAPVGDVLVETIDDRDVEPPIWREHDILIIEGLRSKANEAFNVIRLRAPRQQYWASIADTFAPSYLNVYVANGAVIGASFGDPRRDSDARRALTKAFPGRMIIMLRIDHISEGGGGIKCLTQPMPKKNKDQLQ